MLKQRILRYGLGLALTFIILAHASGHLPITILTTMENLSYDFRLGLRLPEKVDRKVVIVDIDEKSLGEIGHWPWQRNILATIVDNLFDHYEINVLGFDMVFAEADQDPSDTYLMQMANTPLSENQYFRKIFNEAQNSLYRDKIFASSLSDRKTIMGIVFDPRDQSLQKGVLPQPISNISRELIESSLFPSAAGVTANIAILQESAMDGGYFDNPLIDDDGVFRKVPLLQEYQGKLY